MVDSEYIRDLRKKYKKINEVFGPFNNVGHGISGSSMQSKRKILKSFVPKSSKKVNSVKLYRMMKGGKMMKITKSMEEKIGGVYIRDPWGEGFFKLKDLLPKIKQFFSKAYDVAAPHLKKGAEKLLEKGVEVATSKLLKKIEGRGKLESKDVVEKFISQLTMKPKRLNASLGRGVSGGRKQCASKPKSMPKGAVEWREFAVNYYNSEKQENPSLLYKDALKQASKLWKQMKE